MLNIRRNWWNRFFPWLRADHRRPSPARRRLALEELETRNLPQAGTWTLLTNPAPVGIGTMMLLSDGTVMAQEGGTQNWEKLSPNAQGSYVNGAWSALAPMSTQRLYYGSNILPDGRVFLVGGEYSGATLAQNFINTSEIYDPLANTWTAIAKFPQSQFGDDPTEVLPNGTVLAGYLSGPQTYIYDPATNTWTATGTKLRNDQSDEEAWVKLPDNSILSYDIFGSGATVPGHAQRYIPSTATWVDAGSVPVSLSSAAVGFELGPAFRLPDGRILQVGGNSNTAIYTPSTNTWVAGPVIPGGFIADDATGAILPNGQVIFDASGPPVNFAVNPANFGSPTEVFDFNYSTNTISVVATPAALTTALNLASFNTRSLMLPSGQMLFSTSATQLWVFTPTGSPQNAWRPTITSVVNNNNGTFTIHGTQLNGISEGAAYGDDVEMASNYPIVRLTETNGNVVYARTFNWSSTGVATGSSVVSVEFTLPGGLTHGFNLITVIANGIPSLTQGAFTGAKVYYPVRYAYNPGNGILSGNLIVSNLGSFPTMGVALQLAFPALPAGVSVANESGISGGVPVITVPASLLVRGSQYVFIQFRNPYHLPLSTFTHGFPVLFNIGISV